MDKPTPSRVKSNPSKLPGGKCACGNHGLKKTGSDWICARCLAMDEQAGRRNLAPRGRRETH